MRSYLIACHLAVRDMLKERLLSLCAVLSLACVLVPLLVLAGVQHGVIGVLKQRLLSDPAILTVLPAGSANGYTRQWIESLGARPEACFAIARTRDIAATISLEHQTDGQTHHLPVGMEPTASGDPLLAHYNVAPPHGDALVLSASAARKLGVLPGDVVVGSLGRRLASGKLESARLELKVMAVLPLEAEEKDVAYLTLKLLEDTENYRDCIAVPDRGFSGEKASDEPRKYAGFRLYAKSLDDVAALRDFITAQGVEVLTKAREIQAVQGLDKTLTIIFGLIALTVGAGFAASTASSVMAGVRRKDKELGMIRLLGFSGSAIMVFPIVQSLVTALFGTLLADLFYLGVSFCINTLFSSSLQGEKVCSLPWLYFAGALGVVLLLSLLASAQASIRAARIEPSDVLREL